jgi:hypothetical protein
MKVTGSTQFSASPSDRFQLGNDRGTPHPSPSACQRNGASGAVEFMRAAPRGSPRVALSLGAIGRASAEVRVAVALVVVIVSVVVGMAVTSRAWA